MSGTSYSRTAGSDVLPLTWQAIHARHPDQALQPHERTSFDAATDAARAQFVSLAMSALTTPPDFLAFDLAKDPYAPGHYPAAVPEAEGFKANGQLGPGQSPSTAATQLGITEEQLARELSKFSGAVAVVKLMPGTKIFRTVGLTANSAQYGAVTNQLLGSYWEPRCPSDYASIDAWRQATAVLAEWNGDHGYIEVTLDRDLVVLSGATGMQVVDGVNRQVLPGGGPQYFVPRMAEQLPALAHRIATQPLGKIIQPTHFGDDAQ